MKMQIRICGIEPESIVDGPGFRYVWENPGFFLFAVISLLEMVSYFL